LLLGALHSSLEQSMFVGLAPRRGETELICIVDAHESIVDRVCAGDAVGARAAMTYHFDLSVMTMLRADLLTDVQLRSSAVAAR
jgi:DNA-binding FadR family transcriptional regulator